MVGLFMALKAVSPAHLFRLAMTVPLFAVERRLNGRKQVAGIVFREFVP